MAAVFSVNQTPASYAAFTRAWIDFLVANGALAHLESGNAAGTVSTGADVFNAGVLRSWGRYSLLLWGAPREILIQVGQDGTGNTGRAIRVKYSRAATFVSAPTGGSGKSSSVPPSASDEQFWAGGDTDSNANPWGTRILGPTPVSGYRYALMVDTATKVAYALGWQQSNGTTASLWALDALVADTFDPSDGDPFTAYVAGDFFSGMLMAAFDNAGMVRGNGGVINPSSADYASGPRSWWKYGTGSQAFASTPMIAPMTGSQVPTVEVQPYRVSTDNLTGNDLLHPCLYWRDQNNPAPIGYRGCSTLFMWQSGSRAGASTYSLASVGAKDRITAVQQTLPWNGSTPDRGTAATDYRARQVLYPVGGITPDVTKPVVTIVSPAVGTTIGPTDPLVFDVTDNTNSFRRIVCEVVIPALGLNEVAHNGDTFRPTYLAGSSRAAITNGWRYTLYRTPLWPASPGLEVYAIDTAGNEND